VTALQAFSWGMRTPSRIVWSNQPMVSSFDDGLLAGPMDLDAPQQRGPEKKMLFLTIGTVLTHRGSGTEGAVVEFVEGKRVALRDHSGRDHHFKPVDGFFLHLGKPVALRAPRHHTKAAAAPTMTASGSVDTGHVPARVARASRIWVEGIHDAELIERIWGDDLRVEGIVVEQLEGADDLAERVRGFQPGERRRIGVLLDHLVPGSKETRIAESISDPNVLICGHPYVDIWQAIKPSVVDIQAWPVIPMGTPWKEGIMAAVGFSGESGRFWREVLGKVNSYKDVETPLINAVEQLIDFVAVPE